MCVDFFVARDLNVLLRSEPLNLRLFRLLNPSGINLTCVCLSIHQICFFSRENKWPTCSWAAAELDLWSIKTKHVEKFINIWTMNKILTTSETVIEISDIFLFFSKKKKANLWSQLLATSNNKIESNGEGFKTEIIDAMLGYQLSK